MAYQLVRSDPTVSQFEQEGPQIEQEVTPEVPQNEKSSLYFFWNKWIQFAINDVLQLKWLMNMRDTARYRYDTHSHTQSHTHNIKHFQVCTCARENHQHHKRIDCATLAMLSLFGLIVNLRHFNLLPGEELPDASSVVLVPQSVQEDVEGGGGLGQDGSHLRRKGVQRFLINSNSVTLWFPFR